MDDDYEYEHPEECGDSLGKPSKPLVEPYDPHHPKTIEYVLFWIMIGFFILDVTIFLLGYASR
jgi:hypothetical protein